MPFIKPTVLHVPRTQTPEGFEESFDIVNDGVISGGFFPQDDTEPDDRVGIYRLGETLVLEDPSSIRKLVDLLLETDPDSVGTTYTASYSGNNVTQEKWTVTSSGLKIKTIDYTYDGGSKLSTEIRKVYAANGSTVIAQETITYAYTASRITGATTTRDV